MHFQGVIKKMISEFDSPVRYYLNFEEDMLCMIQLLNKEIKIIGPTKKQIEQTRLELIN